jgi:hypothetical protein
MWYVLRCYKQVSQSVSGVIEQLVGELVGRWVGGWVSARVSEITAVVQLLLEAGSWDQGQFRNPEEGERQPFEDVTRQQMLKIQQTEKTSCVV